MIKLSEENPVMAGSSAHTVLRLFYENGPASQMEIARKLRITKAASNQHFSRLIEENYITESAVQPNPRGRPSQVWQIDSARNFFLGLTVEDGALGAVLTDFSENVLIRANRHLHDRADQTALLKLLDDLLKTILNKISKLGGRLLQCFAAIPGMIDQEGLTDPISRPKRCGKASTPTAGCCVPSSNATRAFSKSSSKNISGRFNSGRKA